LTVEVLRFLRDKAQNTIPGDPERVVITVPASWEAGNQNLMRSVAQRAGYETATVDLIAEPVAALAYAFRELHDPAEHLTFLVYDLGGGTFDCAVAQGTAGWYEVLGKPGCLDDVGGAAFDRLLLDLIRDRFSDTAARLLDGPADDPDILRRKLTLKDRCEKFKLRLSVADYHEDLLSELKPPSWFRLDRAEFETLIRSLLRETISECDRLLEELELDWPDVHRVVPVGGSSRIPLVGKMLAQHCGRPVLAIDHPDMAVAQGAALFGRNLLADAAPRRFFVNGRRKVARKQELGFDEVVKLAFDDPPVGQWITFTVTYDHAASARTAGSLLEGKQVRIQDGTVFNVTATDKS
jgi:molecular chaperone DnaK (HSP70)